MACRGRSRAGSNALLEALSAVSPGMQAEEILLLLERFGICRAVIPFCGGHDEGHLGSLQLYTSLDASVPEVKLSEQDVPEAYRQLAWPILSSYQTFAGDFSVEGELSWDVARRSAMLSVTETSYEYQYREFDLNMPADFVGV